LIAPKGKGFFMSQFRTSSRRPWTAAANFLNGAGHRPAEPWRGQAVLRLETLESILAPNLFSLVAGILPTLTSLASVGMTALENYADESLPVDYGPLGTVSSRTDDLESAPANVPTPVVETADTATTGVQSGSETAGTVAQDSESTRSSPNYLDETATDRVFTEPLNLAELSTPLPDHLILPDGLNTDWSSDAPHTGASAGWSAGSASGEGSTPLQSAASTPGYTPAAEPPTPALQTADSGSLVRLAAASPTPQAPNAVSAAPTAPMDASAPLQALAQQGLRFETNEGQIDTHYNFVAHGPAYDVALNSTDAVLAQGPQAGAAPVSLDMHLVGGNPTAAATSAQALPGVTNYFGGPGDTFTGIVSYAQAGFHDVYAGVDVVYHTNPGTQQLEYDFVVAPNADAGQVTLAFRGADQVSLGARGDLVLHTTGGDLVQQAPVAYQEIGGVRHDVASRFTLDSAGQVHFALGAYDHGRALTIDPAYVYSSYLGGAGTDQANAVAVNPMVLNGAERVFVVGSTTSAKFRPNDPNNTPAINPTLIPVNGNFANAAFAIEIDPTKNNNPVYLDYFGGNKVQVATAVAVDSQSNAYITGYTSSTQGFPVTVPGQQGTNPGFQVQHGGQPLNLNLDAFAIFLSANGNQTYGTYLGGPNDDAGYGIALDNNGSVYIAGATASASFNNHVPDANFGAGVPGRSNDGFVAQLTVAGALTSLVYLGGTGTDQLNAVAAGPGGNVFVAGTTNSTDLLNGIKPANVPFQSALAPAAGGGNANDAFVADLVYNANQIAPAVTYDTYFGGDGNDQALGITVDPVAGDAYVVGNTTSSAGLLGAGWGAGGANPVIIQPTVLGATGGQDAWVAKFDSKGNANGAKPYFVYIAGTGTDSATGVALAPNNNATPYLDVTGTTNSPDNNAGKFPATQGVGKLQNFNQGNNNTASDAYLAQLDPFAVNLGNPNPAGSILALSYVGGSDNDSGAGVAHDPWPNTIGNAWVTGSTVSTDFRPANIQGLQLVSGGNTDGFLVAVTGPPAPKPGGV
jgi:hypothetical protein